MSTYSKLMFPTELEDFVVDRLGKLIEYAADEITTNYRKVISSNYVLVLQEFILYISFQNEKVYKKEARLLAGQVLTGVVDNPLLMSYGVYQAH